MARIERGRDISCIVAETPDEWALLEHGLGHGGQLVLDDALYPANGFGLLLPPRTSEATAVRLQRAFEVCAKRHAEATRRRGSFRIV